MKWNSSRFVTHWVPLLFTQNISPFLTGSNLSAYFSRLRSTKTHNLQAIYFLHIQDIKGSRSYPNQGPCFSWHVLKPETTKRNHRNETAETSEMTKTTETSVTAEKTNKTTDVIKQAKVGISRNCPCLLIDHRQPKLEISALANIDIVA